MGTHIVRVSETTHAQVSKIKKETGRTMQNIIDEAVEELSKKRFWEETRADYAALRADKEAWAEELAERKMWEATLADGLEVEHDA